MRTESINLYCIIILSALDDYKIYAQLALKFERRPDYKKKRRSEACQGPKILQHDKDQRSQTSGNQKETVTTDGSTARSACHSKEPMCMHLCTFKYYYKYKYIYIYMYIIISLRVYLVFDRHMCQWVLS